MAFVRAEHGLRHHGIPVDAEMVADTVFYMVLSAFFIVISIWGFALFYGWRFY